MQDPLRISHYPKATLATAGRPQIRRMWVDGSRGGESTPWVRHQASHPQMASPVHPRRGRTDTAGRGQARSCCSARALSVTYLDSTAFGHNLGRRSGEDIVRADEVPRTRRRQDV